MEGTDSSRHSHHRFDGQPIPLETHLHDVADRVESVVPETLETPAGESLADLAWTCGIIHDIGKLTTWFQARLDGETPGGPSQHSPLGAFVTFYALSAGGFEDEDALIGFVAVAKHHGTLPNVTTYVFNRVNAGTTDFGGPTLDELDAQIENIESFVSAMADQIIETATDGQGSWPDFVDAFESDLLDDIRSTVTSGEFGLSADPDALDTTFYDRALQVWSALCLADKTSAASLTGGVEVHHEDYEPDPPETGRLINHLESIRTDAPTSRINELRDEARKAVLDSVDSFVESEGSVATITLPTGLGKTITGLNAALSIRDAQPEPARIIYALPFTSIIDQVASLCMNIFESDGQDATMAIHHHLAETRITLEDVETDGDAHLEYMLGESWRSGLVVTTFVQLFESLTGPANSQSMKLPSLHGSVVILDEPQSLPAEWWAVTRRLATLLTERYDATVIAMTATQPRIFDGEEGPPACSLVESPDRYYREMDRVDFHIDSSAHSYPDAEPSPIGYNEAANRIADATGEGSVLAVCNTIDSAIELSQTVEASGLDTLSANAVLADVLDSHEGHSGTLEPDDLASSIRTARNGDRPVALHLTTRHRPIDRRLLIGATRALLDDGVPVVMISTQLIEAGVDVSFDHVCRDFAPLDSIVQAAGRCNRSNQGDRGTVDIWLLPAPEGSTMLPCRAVYGRSGDSLPKLTARAISDVVGATATSDETVVDEQTLTWEGVNRYYELLADRSPGNREWVEWVDRCEADRLSELSLIEQRKAVDVVVARTQVERTKLRNIEHAYDQRAFETVDESLDSLRELQVSIPIYDEGSKEAARACELDHVHPGAELRRIDTLDSGDSWYSPEWGLTVPEDSLERRFL